MDAQDRYWLESFEISMEEAGCGHLLAQMTDEQRGDVAGGIQGSHENYGMAFYSPPASDRVADVEREWKAKYLSLDAEFKQYREYTGTAMARALKLRSGDTVSLDAQNKRAFLNDGRGTELWL